jgi:patatin-like phospholipase/acyl hydrolase
VGCNRQLERKCFTNFDEESAHIKISQVARCTSAAPGYFPPFQDADGVIYVDGGLTCNNPVFPALHHNRFRMENSIVASVGTGRFEDPSELIQNLHVSRSLLGSIRTAMDGNLGHFVELLVNQVICKKYARSLSFNLSN